MKLIADSGSTKTLWVLVENGTVKKTIQTNGLNPYFHTSESVEAILMADLAPFIVGDHVREVHFYGAGCSTEKNDAMIRESVHLFMRKAAVNVYHDTLGAARALFGRERGIACILGTGCNACYYDGEHIFQKVDSLGFLYGDEGAGSYLGKNLVGKYLKKELPDDLREAFDAQYGLSLEDILNSLYNRPSPNRFLASFSQFMAPRQEHPFVRKMVKDSFLAFFNAQIRHYDNFREIPSSFIGSIAYYYREILAEAAAEEGIKIGKIVKDPVAGLIAFHA
jgi:N-acetylglucosamine kinase-like BadF-type ATPase